MPRYGPGIGLTARSRLGPGRATRQPAYQLWIGPDPGLPLEIQSFAQTAADTLTTSDAVTQSGSFVRTAADTLTVSSSVVAVSGLRFASDTLTISDAVARVVAATRTEADTLTTSDSVVRTAALFRTASDTFTTSTSVQSVSPRSAADAVTTSDTAIRIAALGRTAADTLTTSSTVAVTRILLRTAADTLTVSTSVARTGTFARTAADTATVSTSVAAPTGAHTAADTLTVSTSVARAGSFARTATDFTATIDSVGTSKVYRTASDTLTVSDSVHQPKVFLAASDSLGVASSVDAPTAGAVTTTYAYIGGTYIGGSATPGAGSGGGTGSGDAAGQIEFATATFTQYVNGKPGEAYMRVRDLDSTVTINEGDDWLVTINGQAVWRGFVTQVIETYYADVVDLGVISPMRVIDVRGSDLNVLFIKRVVFKESDPTVVEGTQFPPDTADTTAITELLDHWLDLSSDSLNTTSEVVHVGDLDPEQVTRAWSGGWYWADAMNSIAMLPAAIYYIRPEIDSPHGTLVYGDVDVPTAPFGLSDVPGNSMGGSSTTTLVDDFDRTETDTWGTGNLGSWGGTESSTFSVNGTQGLATNTDFAQPWLALPAAITDTVTEWTFEEFFVWPTMTNGLYEVNLQFSGNGFGTFEWQGLIDYSRPSHTVDITVGGIASGTTDTVTLSTGVAQSGGAHLKVSYVPDTGLIKAKYWLDSIGEPDWQVTAIGPDLGDWATERRMLMSTSGVLSSEDWAWNSVTMTGTTTAPGGDFRGYREMEITRDGTSLANDVLGWGMGYGSQIPVFDRETSATSVAEHGVWQSASVNVGVYKQGTIDRIVGSIINGSPFSHRGAKDDRPYVTLVTYETGLLAGHVVQFESQVWGFSDAIPIRQLTLTFEAPDVPRYELILSHEIDAPWGFIDQFWPRIVLPVPPWPPIPPIGNPGNPIDDHVEPITQHFDDATNAWEILHKIGTSPSDSTITPTEFFAEIGDSTALSADTEVEIRQFLEYTVPADCYLARFHAWAVGRMTAAGLTTPAPLKWAIYDGTWSGTPVFADVGAIIATGEVIPWNQVDSDLPEVQEIDVSVPVQPGGTYKIVFGFNVSQTVTNAQNPPVFATNFEVKERFPAFAPADWISNDRLLTKTSSSLNPAFTSDFDIVFMPRPTALAPTTPQGGTCEIALRVDSTHYSTIQSYQLNSTLVFRSGLLQYRGTDYTEDSDLQTLVFSGAVPSTDVVYVCYSIGESIA